jgi:hypothetical protein
MSRSLHPLRRESVLPTQEQRTKSTNVLQQKNNSRNAYIVPRSNHSQALLHLGQQRWLQRSSDQEHHNPEWLQQLHQRGLQPEP